MKAIIPVAGYATRLYPLTKNKPKALIEVKGKPILEHIIRKIEELGAVDHTYLVTNARFFQAFEYWFDEFETKLPIKVVNDHTESNEDRLGQVGDILYAIEEEQIDDDLLIIAGDNLFNFSLKPSYKFFLKKKASVNALFDIRTKEKAKKLGVVKLDQDMKFAAFEEKPQSPSSTLVSLGIMYFPTVIIPKLKQYIDEKNNPDKVGHFFEWLIKHEPVYGYTYKKKWFDIGSFEALGQAREEFKG